MRKSRRLCRLALNGLQCLIALIVAGILQPAGWSAEAQRPNVIVIYTDDQGYGDASCLNPESKFRTPNLDRLAGEGIRFTDGHCSDTVCTPSRYGLLTGRYCWRTTKKTGVMGAEGDCLIADGRMTLASLFQDHGYQTAMVGKWHLGMDFPGEKGNRDWTRPVKDMPLDKGFQYFFGIPASMNYGVLAWFEGRYAKVPPTEFTAKKPNRIALADYRIQPPYQPTPAAVLRALGKPGMEVAPDFVDAQCLTRFTNQAIEWIRNRTQARQTKPFFLYLPYTSPHKPVIPLAEFRGRGSAGAYGEFMIETDHHVGRLLAVLKELELDENTLIVFTSDNGPENTWKARQQKFKHFSNGIYREGKRSIYEGGHRVPFFIRWPEGIAQPGRKYTAPVCQTDLLATFATMLKADLPANAAEDSVSFYSVLTDPDAKQLRPPMFHHAANGRFAIRDGRWKLVLKHRRQVRELYDLDSDPREQNNVVQDHPDVADRLQATATRMVREGRSSPGPRQKNDSDYWPDLSWMTAEQYSQ